MSCTVDFLLYFCHISFHRNAIASASHFQISDISLCNILIIPLNHFEQCDVTVHKILLTSEEFITI